MRDIFDDDEYGWLDDPDEGMDDDELLKAAWQEMHSGIVENIKSLQAAELLHEYYAQGTLEWVTQAGKQILVQDFEQGHLYNTIQFLKRTGKGLRWSHVLKAWLTILNKELRTRTKNKSNGVS